MSDIMPFKQNLIVIFGMEHDSRFDEDFIQHKVEVVLQKSDTCRDVRHIEIAIHGAGCTLTRIIYHEDWKEGHFIDFFEQKIKNAFLEWVDYVQRVHQYPTFLNYFPA